jgi:hypothetical protein
VKRCTGPDGFPICERCHKPTPALKIDHIEAVGEVDSGFIERMFRPSKLLQGWCHECHKQKTKEERAALKAKRKKKSFCDAY